MLKEGSRIGQRYEILSRVGSGGMADVYKAKDHVLNRLVAVKVMKSEFKEDPNFITKFRKEAQAAAGLAHPNIVNVYDVGDDNGLYYIVMELVEGITLKDYITKKGRLSVKEATSIAIQVSLGLQAAHDRGIIHRDVKPQNIIISTDGKVKLSDFGIAKATNSNTITSNVMGSVHYSSPEQVRGGFSNAQSDIYSLGITMFEMVTGRVPFDGDTTVSIAIKHLQEEIESPRKYAPELPQALEQIILKCTQKSPDRRYDNMAGLIDDLKHSLIEPNGNFVSLVPLSAHAQTVMMTPQDMETIRNVETPIKQKEETAPQRLKKSDYDDYDDDDYDDDDYDDDDYDDYDDDDDEKSSGLEKMVTIGGFVIGGIIIIILIVLIMQAMGAIGGKKSGSDQTSSQSTSISSSKSDSSSSSSDSKSEDADENTDNETTPSAAQVTVPDLTGKSIDEAKSLANSLGLGIQDGGQETSDVEAGKISSQDPAAGASADKNSTITYKTSAGAGQVTIPDSVIGMSEVDATATLNGVGINVNNVVRTPSDSVPEGQVISTDPAVGSSVENGANISIVVSTGPDATPTAEATPTPTAEATPTPTQAAGDETVAIASYRGLDLETVQSSLEAKGLVVKVEYDTVAGLNVGDVMGQSIESGSSVPVGTEITITVNDPDRAGQ